MEVRSVVSEAKKKSQKIWDASNTVRFTTKFNKRTDEDIIAILERADSKQGLIRKALREYIANHKEENGEG